MLNCAVIGLGVGEQHARALLSHPLTELKGICDNDPKRITDFIDKYKFNPSYIKRFSEILADESISLVSIASFDHNHFEQVMACLHHGKHVFVEKPLCQTREQLEKIYALWKSSGLALASNLILRKAPLYLWLNKLIQNDEFGEIYSLDMDYLYGRVHKIITGWRVKVDNYSVMAGGGIHLIDLMILFMNRKPYQVQSYVNKIATKGTPFRYHDFHAATFYFNQGAIGRVSANFGCMHHHQHVLRVYGTKGTFIYDDMGARIHKKREEDAVGEPIDLVAKGMDKGSLLLDFVETILKDNHKHDTQKEFDLMCAVIAADQAIASPNSLIDIVYLI